MLIKNLITRNKLKKIREHVILVTEARKSFLEHAVRDAKEVKTNVEMCPMPLKALSQLLEDIIFAAGDCLQRDAALRECLENNEYSYVANISKAADAQYLKVKKLTELLITQAEKHGLSRRAYVV